MGGSCRHTPRAIRRPARARPARPRCISALGPGWTASEAPQGCSRPGRSAPRAGTPEESRRAGPPVSLRERPDLVSERVNPASKLASSGFVRNRSRKFSSVRKSPLSSFLVFPGAKGRASLVKRRRNNTISPDSDPSTPFALAEHICSACAIPRNAVWKPTTCGSHSRGSRALSRVVTPRECVAAALKVGRCPDMQGSRIARKDRLERKNWGETFLIRWWWRYTRPLIAGCPGRL